MSSIILRQHQKDALHQMHHKDVGSIIMGTGAGKSIIFIQNTIKQFESTDPQTVCIVAPRILLACQLSQEYEKHISNAKFIHVHSGANLKFYRTTNSDNIKEWHNIHKDHHKLIFTSYNSLKKVIESGIKVKNYYFDECHNSVKKNFFPHIKDAVKTADKKYFFTATPKNSEIPSVKPGMNIQEVYGDILCNIPMTEMVDNGYVLPPRVIRERVRGLDNDDEMNRNIIINALDDNIPQKVLVSVKNTNSLMSLLSETDFEKQAADRGYHVMHITSMHGAFIDGKSMRKAEFFKILNEWGKNDSKKFILLNYSILSEGINCPGLDCTIFLRNMNVIGICQVIGRIIRLHNEDADKISNGDLEVGDYNNYKKPHGMVILPVYDEYSQRVADLVEEVIEKSFIDGETITQVIPKPKKKKSK